MATSAVNTGSWHMLRETGRLKTGRHECSQAAGILQGGRAACSAFCSSRPGSFTHRLLKPCHVTPVHHPSHLEDELSAMQKAVQESRPQGPRHHNHPIHLQPTHLGPCMARLPDELGDAALLAAAHTLAHHLSHLLREQQSPPSPLPGPAASCIIAYTPQQTTQLVALLQELQQELLGPHPHHGLAFQPLLTNKAAGFVHRSHHSHHKEEINQALVTLLPFDTLPDPATAAAALHTQQAGGSLLLPNGPSACSISLEPGSAESSSPRTSLTSTDGCASSYTTTSSSRKGASGAAAAAAAACYTSSYLATAAASTPAIRVGSHSEPRAVAETLVSVLMEPSPAVLTLANGSSSSSVCRTVMMKALIKARRRLLTSDAGVDLIALLGPSSRQHTHQGPSHHQHQQQQQQLAAKSTQQAQVLSSLDPGFISPAGPPLAAVAAGGGVGGAAGAGNGSGGPGARSSRQEGAGVAASSSSSGHQGLQVLVLPWWLTDG